MTAEAAIKKAPGVLAVDVDYKSGQATIGIARGADLPRDEIRTALDKIGYEGRFPN